MKRKSTLTKSQTDWERLGTMTDEEIDFSDVEEITPEQFAQAVVRRGLKAAPKKQQITLRVDSDVIKWFKSRGRGYQTKINALLRAYMNAHGRR
jgi:uncharacterized protein (DUF4415 family)